MYKMQGFAHEFQRTLTTTVQCGEAVHTISLLLFIYLNNMNWLEANEYYKVFTHK